MYTPDALLIEHLWDALDRRVLGRFPVLGNVRRLQIVLQEEWTNISQATIVTLVNSRRKCIEGCSWRTYELLIFGIYGVYPMLLKLLPNV
jgi:hypothetical protein